MGALRPAQPTPRPPHILSCGGPSTQFPATALHLLTTHPGAVPADQQLICLPGDCYLLAPAAALSGVVRRALDSLLSAPPLYRHMDLWVDPDGVSLSPPLPDPPASEPSDGDTESCATFRTDSEGDSL